MTSVFSGSEAKRAKTGSLGPDEGTQGIEADAHVFHFDFGAIIYASLAEVAGATLLVFTIDRLGRRLMHSLSFTMGGMLVFGLCWVASIRNQATNEDLANFHMREATILLAVLARMFIFSGSTITWIWTAELFTTAQRTTGHSLANAGGRIGGFLAPYVVSDSAPLRWIGTTMMLISLLIVIVARTLPDTHGVTMGGAITVRSTKPDATGQTKKKLGHSDYHNVPAAAHHSIT